MKTNSTPAFMYQSITLLLLIFCQAFFSFSVTAQDYLPVNSNKKPGVADFQRYFQEWSEGKNLDSTKGWKWYKRWEEDYSRRTTLGRPAPQSEIYLNEAVRFSELKKQTVASKKSAWTAVGPDVFPSPGISYFGMGRINCIAFHPKWLHSVLI